MVEKITCVAHAAERVDTVAGRLDGLDNKLGRLLDAISSTQSARPGTGLIES